MGGSSGRELWIAGGMGSSSASRVSSSAGRSPPARCRPSDVRTMWPSTSQPGRRGQFAAETVRTSRPANSGVVSTATPAAASSASASRSRRSPGSPGTSVASAVCGRPARIRPISPVSTRPGPTSTKIRTPAAYIASIWSTNRTGRAT